MKHSVFPNAATSSARDPIKRPRGGAPVGVLSELPAVERAAILYLRQWFSGNPDKIWADFSRSFARPDAEYAMESFVRLMKTVQNDARRPLMRHSPECECFGGDECAFAQFVAAAASGDEHDAMTFALHLFESVEAKCALGAAAMCGHAFQSMASQTRAVPQEFARRPTHPTPNFEQ